MRRTRASGLFWNIKFGGGPKKSHLRDLDLIFSQRNMNLCLQRVNAYLRAAWNPHKSEPLNVSGDLLTESRRRGAGALRSYQFLLPPQPSLPPGMTHLSLHRARPGLSLAQKTACIFCCCYLAIMPGSFLSMNSCIHWCSVELLRNLRKDSTYLLWSVNRLLMEDAIFGFLSDREGRDV